MTTSGVYTVQYSRDDLITAALRKLGVVAQGQTPASEDLTNGAMAINTVIGYLRTKGMPLWRRMRYTFTPTSGTSSYNIGTGQALDIPYPLKMYQVFRTQSGTVIDMDLESDYNFNILPTTSSGVPIKATYQPYNNYGTLRLWPTPDSTTGVTITLDYQMPFQYFTASTDTMDLPEEWYLPLIYQLAVVLAPEWGIALPDRQLLQAEATRYLDEVLGFGTEDASMFIQPDIRNRR